MKKYILIATAFIAFSAFVAVVSTWKNDPAHSQVFFTVTHLGISNVSGTFADGEVTIQSSKPDFSDAVFEATAKVASIDTRVDARNNHLKSPDFFDAEKYPLITFKSNKLENVGENKYKVTGDLTIRDITKSVTFDLTFRGTVENPMSKTQTAGFHLSGSVKRSDFQIGPSFPELVISDVVKIEADGEFTQSK